MNEIRPTAPERTAAFLSYLDERLAEIEGQGRTLIRKDEVVDLVLDLRNEARDLQELDDFLAGEMG